MTHRYGRRNWALGMAAVCILLGGSALAVGQVRLGVGIAVPGLSIGINVPAYPQLVPIPGYPVYYAPGLSANLFFYDGLYWVLAGDDWYYSSWYDGPWYVVEPELVPDFILRIPILYYRSPPPYFLHWNRAAPPRWGEHWGRTWEQRRPGWNRWDRAAVPPRAPLPRYQRGYPRGGYPGAERQRSLENRYYNYRPTDPRDRARLQQVPQPGRRVAPQPNQQPPRRQGRMMGSPEAPRGQPGAAQRPRAASPSPPPAYRERGAPSASRPAAQPGARSAQPTHNSGAPGRQEQRNGTQRRDAGQGRRPPERAAGTPPG
jgi:hypothetical protein